MQLNDIHGKLNPTQVRRLVRPRCADEIAEPIVGAITADLEPSQGSEVLLLVNGFGGTPLMELYLVYDIVAGLCRDRGIEIARSMVGNLTTSLEMAGCSVTLTKTDGDMLTHWDAPVHTAGLRWGC